MAAQMKIFRNSGCEIMLNPQKSLYRQNSEDTSPSHMVSDSSEGISQKKLEFLVCINLVAVACGEACLAKAVHGELSLQTEMKTLHLVTQYVARHQLAHY